MKTKTTDLAIDPTQLPVRDVMHKDVLTLQVDATVEEAITLLDEYRVSGAPVLDDADHLVGVFSLRDVARREHLAGDRLAVESRPGPGVLDDEGELVDPDFFSREDYSPDVLGRVRVGEWMTGGVVTVAPDAPLSEVCRTLLSESIHRVFVVEDGALRGVFSSYDLVRLLAR